MNFEKTSKSNGNKSNKVLPAQEKKRDKIKLYIRVSALIITTNILTIALIPHGINDTKESIPSSTTPKPPLEYLDIKIPLNLRVPLDENMKAITIIDERGNIVCQKAFLIPQSNGQSKLFKDEDFENYRLYVDQKDISNLIAKKSQRLWGYPFTSKLLQNPKRKNVYEITF